MPEFDMFVGEREPEVSVRYDIDRFRSGKLWLELRNDSVCLTPQEAIALSKYLLMSALDLELRENADKIDGEDNK